MYLVFLDIEQKVMCDKISQICDHDSTPISAVIIVGSGSKPYMKRRMGITNDPDFLEYGPRKPSERARARVQEPKSKLVGRKIENDIRSVRRTF